MENEEISPAALEAPSEQMSSTEFQRMLYSWFEEKGLVADLRSYLRVLMIRKLKNTCVGKLDQSKAASFSLPKQALCLVIAEHLLREGCHYTLSIFSTEVPGVASHLPFSLFEAHCSKESGNWRFDQDSVLNVLELLGISKNSNESLRIAGLYFRNYGSLLSCLISSKSVDKADFGKFENEEKEDVGDYLERVMSLMGVPSDVTDEVRKKIYDTVIRERRRNEATIQLQLGRVIEEMKEQLLARDHQIKELITDQVVKKKDNKKLKTDLKETRKQLNQMILQEKSAKMKEEQIKEQLHEIERLRDSFEKDKNTGHCTQKHCSENCQRNIQLVDNLQKEILRIQDLEKDKTIEIERLNSKIHLLITDLQSSKLKIDFLNSCLQRYNQMSLQPGEEPPHYSSDEISDNLTEEVLKEVRSKLMELERESDELDIRLKKMKMK